MRSYAKGSVLIKGLIMNASNRVVEVYVQNERFNPRIQATVPGAWIAVHANGCEVAICRDYEARDEAHAREIYAQRQD